MRTLSLPSAPRRVLVICMRRLGDVLLSSALIRSLRRAWPEARIEVLVNAGSAPALRGNPDIDELLVQPERAGTREWLKVAARIFRRYDLAVCTMHNDRPQLYALLASSRRVTVVPAQGEPGARWKRWLSDAWSEQALGAVHAVETYLALADCLGVPRLPAVVPPRPASEAALDQALGAGWRQRPYAVVHPAPLYRYKAWTIDGWQVLLRDLLGRGLHVCLTGGGSAREARTLEEACAGLTPEQRARVALFNGRVSFAELTPLIEHAKVFVGPDTSVTHLAAATGVPTIALFGPSHPVAWGPWPQGWSSPAGPWQMRAVLQRQGNIWLVQGELDCVPCLNEGCERHLDSRADCLDHLSPERVIAVVDQALMPGPAQGPMSQKVIPIHARPAGQIVGA
jgi:heptosyltransferase-3